MSISRARWSDTEKKAVIDCYNLATDADDFLDRLQRTLGTSFVRRTIKAYLTYLNEALVPKSAPRLSVYQSLCDANQKEIAANKAAEETAKLAAVASVAATPVAATPVPTAPNFNWVEKEIDVVPRVPPGRVSPPSMFRDPLLPTLNEAMAAQNASPPAPVRPQPDPNARVPRHYSALPLKSGITAEELATVFGLQRTKVVDAFTYGFIPTSDGTHIPYSKAQRIHDAMSEGYTFSEACRLVYPNASGLLPMQALIEKGDTSAIADQSAVVVPGFKAGKVTLKVDDWTVSGGQMNPKSVAKMAGDLTHGPFVTSVEVLSGPPALFQGGGVFPTVKSVEASAGPTKTLEPGGAAIQYAEVTRVKLNPVAATEDPASSAAPGVQSGAFEHYTLEAVRDGVITVAQAVDILNPTDTSKAIWALSLMASGKITVVQCDRLLFAKSV